MGKANLRNSDLEGDKTLITQFKPKCIDTNKELRPFLVNIVGKGFGEAKLLEPGKYKIGRSENADIYIDDESISRFHAEIKITETDFVISDLNSTNGTYVNEKIIKFQRLNDGDKIRIGSNVIKFLYGGNIETHYHEEIYKRSVLDGLTQIYNKRYFLDQLNKEISRSKRYQKDIGLIFFDIDYFKKLNDTLGHQAGDECLKQLAKLVKESLRENDCFCRYGGEEFVIIIPETSRENLILVAEKIRQKVQNTDFIYNTIKINMTISLGLFFTDFMNIVNQKLSPQDIIEFADAKLYESKNNGRNQFSI